MSAIIYDCDQGTPEWYAARAGIPTASEFATVMASGKDGGASVTRRKYMLELAGQLITGDVADSYSNAHMERGKVMEDEARDYYAFMFDAELTRVGFIRNGMKGCSPDSLIGADGMLEIKTKLPHLLAEVILADKFPAAHVAQCQGALWVAEREWIDIECYWPKMPTFVKRAYRDEAYIKTLADAVAKFNDELEDVVRKLRAYGKPPETAFASTLLAG